MGMRFTLDGEPFELTPDIVRTRLQGQVPEGIRRRPRTNSDARLTSLERIGGGRVHEPSGARDADRKEFESD